MTFTTDPPLVSDTGSSAVRNGDAISYVSLDVANLPAEQKQGDVALVHDENAYFQDKPAGEPFEARDILYEYSEPTREGGTNGLWMTFDGTRFYECDGQFGDDRVYQFNLSTPFEVNTKSYNGLMVPQNNGIEGLTFNNSGTKLFVVCRVEAKIEEHNLSTPFDVTTDTFTTSINSQDSTPFEIRFNNDGTKLYECGTDNGGTIYESDLSTPFDITTATFSQSIASVESSPNAIEFNDDGTKLYEAAKDTGNLSQSILTTPFDISTATFDVQVDLVGNSQKTGIIWRDSGDRFYNTNDNTNDVRYYELNTGGWTQL